MTVAVTVTTVGPDFTQMGSFGTAQMFGESVVASMDRSYILRMPEWARRKEGPVQLATLLDAREFKGAYYIDYCLDKEGEEPRTVYSVVGMGSNGRLRRLYTVSRGRWAGCGGARQTIGRGSTVKSSGRAGPGRAVVASSPVLPLPKCCRAGQCHCAGTRPGGVQAGPAAHGAVVCGAAGVVPEPCALSPERRGGETTARLAPRSAYGCFTRGSG